MVSDVRMPFHDWVYASDASIRKGAFCSTKLSAKVLEPLWQSGDFQGGHVDLESWQQQLMREVVSDDDDDATKANGVFSEEEEAQTSPEDNPEAAVPKPMAQYYEYVEVQA